MKEIHILLDQNDFEALTRGDIVQKNEVKIALRDIGYQPMQQIIKKHEDALSEKLSHCKHPHLTRPYPSATYGICLTCGRTIFD